MEKILSITLPLQPHAGGLGRKGREGGLGGGMEGRDRKEGIQIGKEDIKVNLFTNVRIVFIENPKEYTKNSQN